MKESLLRINPNNYLATTMGQALFKVLDIQNDKVSALLCLML